MTISDRDYEYCGAHIKRSRKSIREVENEVKKLPVSSPSHIISQCQQHIENSVKCLIMLSDAGWVYGHGLDFEDAEELFDVDTPDNFHREDDFPRAVFLTQFWEEFYEKAKYGNEELSIPPDTFFTDEDAELAFEHAKWCVNLAKRYFDAVGQSR